MKYIFTIFRDNQIFLYPYRAAKRPQVPFETRLMYSRHDEKLRQCYAPRFAPLFLLSIPVIRQLAKEIRIHNSNRFSSLFVPPTPPFLDDTCASANCYPFVYTRLIEPPTRGEALFAIPWCRTCRGIVGRTKS